MNKRLLALAALSVAAAAVIAQTMVGTPFQSRAAVHVLRDSVQTLQGAYIMLPPEPVLPDVESFAWNAEGTRLGVVVKSREEEVREALKDLSRRPEVVEERQIAIVDARTAKATWVTGINLQVDQAVVEWPEGMNFCVVTTAWEPPQNPEQEYPSYGLAYYLVNPTTGKAQLLGQADGATNHIQLDPLDSGRMLMTTSLRDGKIWHHKTSIIDAQGRSLPTLPGLDQAVEQGWIFDAWYKKYGFVMYRTREVAVLMPNGSVQPLDSAAFQAERRLAQQGLDPSQPLVLNQRPSPQGQELWLMARPDMGVQPAALVCTVTENALLSPKRNGIAYTSQQMLWIRRLVYMDGEKYALLRREAVKLDAMDVAKQVGVAVLMYSTDYDDEFPVNNFGDVLSPYARDPGIFGRFNFDLPRGSSTAIKDPAKTVLGHVQTDGGRATVYADGHVEWKDRQP